MGRFFKRRNKNNMWLPDDKDLDAIDWAGQSFTASGGLMAPLYSTTGTNTGNNWQFQNTNFYVNWIDPQPLDYSKLPRHSSTEPIKAQKVATLVPDKNGRIAFSALSAGRTYGVNDVASHTINTLDFTGQPEDDSHLFKDRPYCGSCGFFAVDKVEHAYADQVVLDVELTGLVVKHETGYRGENQRVTKVGVADTCTCGKPAVGVYLNSSRFIPTCGCKNTIWVNYTIITLEQLASEWGVEVSWRKAESGDCSYTSTSWITTSSGISIGNTVRNSFPMHTIGSNPIVFNKDIKFTGLTNS